MQLHDIMLKIFVMIIIVRERAERLCAGEKEHEKKRLCVTQQEGVRA